MKNWIRVILIIILGIIFLINIPTLIASFLMSGEPIETGTQVGIMFLIIFGIYKLIRSYKKHKSLKSNFHSRKSGKKKT